MNTAVSNLMTQRESEPATARPRVLPQEVLDTVRGRLGRPSAVTASEEQVLDDLCSAIVTGETAFDQALARLRLQRDLTDGDVVDSLIPALARRLGDDWSSNRRGFADVTVGTCRLMSVLRRMSRDWAADSSSNWRAPRIAMIALRDEQHVLGMLVATSRFRRAGVSVQMLTGRDDAELCDVVGQGGYDAVTLSIGTLERVEPARKFIKMLRQNVEECPTVIAGGAVFGEADAIRASLGADHFTCDPDEAIRLCLMNRNGERPNGGRNPT